MALPASVGLRLEMLLLGPEERRAGGEGGKEEEEEGGVVGMKRSSMHVQSHSEWAPANIGPYSQAYTVSL